MSIEIKTQTIIKAKPEIVWEILTDFNKYPSWNPFIKSISGDITIGKKIKVIIEPLGAKPVTFNPQILTFDKNKEFSWIGHLLIKGIFDGEHKFKLIDNFDGTTTLIQNEIFRGLLVPLFKKQLRTKTKKGFIEMNEKLKEIAEIY